MSGIAQALQRLAEPADLDPALAQAAFADLMDGAASDPQIAGFLMGLRARGETPEILAAGAEVLRARMTPVRAPALCVDTCGTGGDAKGTFNISTAAAIVAAGAGARVAKHGNRSVSSKSGSSDVLAALGVNLDMGPERAARAIAQAGVGFLYAPAHHSAVARVAQARKALGVRTVFNLLGPLANPAGAKRQLLGVWSEAWLEPMAQALQHLGAERAWVVHGRDGLDEITNTAVTEGVELKDGKITPFTLAPEDVELERAEPDALTGGDAAANAEAIEALLQGAPGAFRDVTVMNAGACLVLADRAKDLADAVRLAELAIDNGSARRALDQLIRISHDAL